VPDRDTAHHIGRRLVVGGLDPDPQPLAGPEAGRRPARSGIS